MRTALPAVLGAGVIADLTAAADATASAPAAAMDRAWPAIERAMFRLAGLAVSRWVAAGRPGDGELPLPRRDGAVGPLAMGAAIDLIGFCGARAELLPTEKLTMPAVNRLGAAVDAMASAIAGMDDRRIASPRLDLAGLVTATRGGRRGISLPAALERLTRLRNLEAHHAGRPEPWVDGHPDYARLFAPLLIDAAWATFTASELTASLRGWFVATIAELAPARAGRPALVSLTPDAADLQRAYADAAPPGLTAGDAVVIAISTDPTRARIVMPFIDLAYGVPPALSDPA